ncbi:MULTISPECIES: hypothetical protein [Wolbachia]|nr:MULTISPECIES: hypothetical protein [unclassified Wolbachia]MBS9529612.1 hypothetical protein [Wolbachia endosymbiont of Ceratitis capitata]MCX3064734.1 hypothetical protein [Wolbachia endosymbiont of Drosophila pseudotakahashii]UZE38644.1 hypothetical protein ONI09_00570 [Wolbachia endosymbiont of Drosophila pseudotakahashii]
MKLSTNFVKHNKWCHSSAPVMSFQRVTLESRNFIKLVSIKIAVLR